MFSWENVPEKARYHKYSGGLAVIQQPILISDYGNGKALLLSRLMPIAIARAIAM